MAGAALYSMAAAECRADAASMNISGTVADAACTIYSGADMIFDFTTLTVSPGKITLGTTLGIQQSILMLTNCPENTYISYILRGEADGTDSGLFKVTSGSGKAEGIGYKVQVKIPSVGNSFIDVMPATQSAWVPTTKSSTDIGSFAFITVKTTAITTQEKVTPGLMDTAMTYSIMYR